MPMMYIYIYYGINIYNTWHLVHQRAAHEGNDTGWTGHDCGGCHYGCEINSSMDVGRREGVCNWCVETRPGPTQSSNAARPRWLLWAPVTVKCARSNVRLYYRRRIRRTRLTPSRSVDSFTITKTKTETTSSCSYSRETARRLINLESQTGMELRLLVSTARLEG